MGGYWIKRGDHDSRGGSVRGDSIRPDHRTTIKRGNKTKVNFIINTKNRFTAVYPIGTVLFSTSQVTTHHPTKQHHPPCQHNLTCLATSKTKLNAEHSPAKHATHTNSVKTISSTITWAEDDITSLAKANTDAKCSCAIDLAHRITNNTATGT
jgi:hypothetical protein